jgi:hypothetical protein
MRARVLHMRRKMPACLRTVLEAMPPAEFSSVLRWVNAQTSIGAIDNQMLDTLTRIKDARKAKRKADAAFQRELNKESAPGVVQC